MVFKKVYQLTAVMHLHGARAGGEARAPDETGSPARRLNPLRYGGGRLAPPSTAFSNRVICHCVL